MDINGNESEGITALKDWLFERVSDDNDIVVDEMQEEFAAYYDQIEADKDSGFPGSPEYQKNVKLLESGSIADLQTPSGKLKIKLNKDKQKITDGIGECWYGGQRNAQGFPHGEGGLVYPNKDVFKGTFNNGVLDRQGKLTQRCNLNIEGTVFENHRKSLIRYYVKNGHFGEFLRLNSIITRQVIFVGLKLVEMPTMRHFW